MYVYKLKLPGKKEMYDNVPLGLYECFIWLKLPRLK